MSDPCLPLLLDQLNRDSARTLWIVDENLPASAVAGIAARPSLLAISNRVDSSQALARHSLENELSDFEFNYEAGSFERIIYRVSKERALVHHCINKASTLLKDGGELILIGRKNDGMKTHLRNAEHLLGGKATSKKHGLCYLAAVRNIPERRGDKLPCDDYPALREITAGDFIFFSKPGIFGWNKVDRGSKLLLRVLQAHSAEFNTEGRLLDLGCGWGYLILATAKHGFSERVATDNNVTALVAARRNFAAANLKVTVVADDCGSQLDGGFHLILCNPPFHQGFGVSEDLSKKFVQQTARLLRPQGDALFVVNEFIPLERLAKSHFTRIEQLAHESGFKIVRLSHR